MFQCNDSQILKHNNIVSILIKKKIGKNIVMSVILNFFVIHVYLLTQVELLVLNSIYLGLEVNATMPHPQYIEEITEIL